MVLLKMNRHSPLVSFRSWLLIVLGWCCCFGTTRMMKITAVASFVLQQHHFLLPYGYSTTSCNRRFSYHSALQRCGESTALSSSTYKGVTKQEKDTTTTTKTKNQQHSTDTKEKENQVVSTTPLDEDSAPQLFQYNRGDTRGACLLLEDVFVHRGPASILNQITWRVEPRTKWALVGANGSGKSTLLKSIVGEIPHTSGRIIIGTNERVGYLSQTAVAGSERTIYDEVCSGMIDLNLAKQQMATAEEKGDWVALERATTRFEALGGYQLDQKVAYVLNGLGFSNFDKKCSELSGGWQMRVAFARLLLSESSLTLLDEPSNHLDHAAKKFLARYLADYDGDGTMILVTHDVELLQSMDHIAEVIPGSGSLQLYKSCNYKQYLALKQERAAAALAEYERNQAKADKLQGFVDRFGASATKASAAQSRVKQIEKMKNSGLLDAPAQAVIAQRFKPTMVLSDPPKAVGHVLLSLCDASVGYEGKELVSQVNLEVTKGMKLLIRGPNGAGKSTILHSLRGTLKLLKGERKENPLLRLGVFTQDLAQELDHAARAVDIVTAYARNGSDGDITVSEQAARSAMGRLGLQGESSLRRISDLSGGEKARVALSMFALKPSNVYLLDEASNHLDIECVEALSEALSRWGDLTGAIVVVSHDQTFCEKIEFTHVATVRDGTFTLEERGARPSDWVVDGLAEGGYSSKNAEPVSSRDNGASSSSNNIDPKLRKQAYNAPKRIAKLEQLIQQSEASMADLDREMLANGNNVGKLVSLTKAKENLEAKVAEYIKEWDELESILAQFR